MTDDTKLSEDIRFFRDQLDICQVADVEGFKDGLDRALTMFAAKAVELEGASGPPMPAALRLADKLTRLGVTRGASVQPPLSCAIQDIAEIMEAAYRSGRGLSDKDLCRCIAELNSLSAKAWTPEVEKPAGGPRAIASRDENGHLAPPANVVDLAAVRQERST